MPFGEAELVANVNSEAYEDGPAVWAMACYYSLPPFAVVSTLKYSSPVATACRMTLESPSISMISA